MYFNDDKGNVAKNCEWPLGHFKRLSAFIHFRPYLIRKGFSSKWGEMGLQFPKWFLVTSTAK